MKPGLVKNTLYACLRNLHRNDYIKEHLELIKFLNGKGISDGMTPIPLTMSPDYFAEETKLCLNSLEMVNRIKNSNYFYNLQHYNGTSIILKEFCGGTNKLINQFYLHPSNIVALQYAITALDSKKKYTFVDYGCGLGNFMGYLKKQFPESFFIGIDNFSQISREDIERFQELSFKIKVSPEYKGKADYVFCLVLPIQRVIDKIVRLNPKEIIFMTKHLREGTDFLKDFRIILVNDLITIIAPKKLRN